MKSFTKFFVKGKLLLIPLLIGWFIFEVFGKNIFFVLIYFFLIYLTVKLGIDFIHASSRKELREEIRRTPFKFIIFLIFFLICGFIFSNILSIGEKL